MLCIKLLKICTDKGICIKIEFYWKLLKKSRIIHFLPSTNLLPFYQVNC